jgi:di/tricarboxylate transporter
LLLVKGDQRDINSIMMRFNVAIQPATYETSDLSEMLLTHEVGLAEVLIAPRSAYIGRTIAQSQISTKYGIQILRIRRQDRPVDPQNVRMAFGDALLVRGTWEDIEILQNERRNFVVVGSPDALARQVVRLSGRSAVAVIALLAMIAMMVSGVVPAVIAAMIAAGVMVLGGCLTMGQAYRSISWGSVVLIAAMIPMSIALQETGGAEYIASGMVNLVGSSGTLLLLAGVFLLTSALSQVMSNTATTIIIAPIVLRAALDLNVSPYPLLMAVAISASTALMSPIGTTTNMMVAAPGGYKFSDYIKVGAPLVFLFLIISLILVPIIWPF